MLQVEGQSSLELVLASCEQTEKWSRRRRVQWPCCASSLTIPPPPEPAGKGRGAEALLIAEGPAVGVGYVESLAGELEKVNRRHTINSLIHSVVCL